MPINSFHSHITHLKVALVEKIKLAASKEDYPSADLHFENTITQYPTLINDNEKCPLLIMIAGLWSANYKKERVYKKHLKPHKNIRLFVEQYLIKMLQHHAINLNVQHLYMHGSTLMHWFVAWDRPYEAIVFLEMIKKYNKKIDLNTLDASNRSVLSLLIARKYFGRTAAAEAEDNILIHRLIADGTNIYVPDCFQNTVLHYVCMKRDIYSLMLLNTLNLHPLWNHKNIYHETPVDLCWASYAKVTQKVRQAYNASRIEAMFNKSRWEQAGPEFASYVNNISDYLVNLSEQDK